MSLEEKIDSLISAIDRFTSCFSIREVEGVTVTTNIPKTSRTRRTKAQIEADKKKNPCSIDLEPVTDKQAVKAMVDTVDPLAILDTPTPAEDEDKITEEKLRLAGSELCEIGGEAGLEVAKKLIVKAGFQALDQVTEDKYKPLFDAFKLAVLTWKK